MPAESPRTLCISLHDVAPTTLADCARTLAFLDDLKLGPVALLVIPDFHGRGRVDRDRRFMSFIESRVLQGDEIVLHGYRHTDTEPPARGLRNWLVRRIWPDQQAEFSRLSFAAARSRLLHGLAILRSAGWQPSGFVAPAGLMSTGTRDALEDLPLRYFSTRDAVTLLGSEQRIAAPSLVVSVHAADRRASSWLWMQALVRRCATQPILRVALHPTNHRAPAFERLWGILRPQIADRRLITEGHLVPRHARRRRPGISSASVGQESPVSRIGGAGSTF
jgi:uncharacterized protein